MKKRDAEPYAHVAPGCCRRRRCARAALMRQKMLQEGLTKATITGDSACVKRALNLAYREWGCLDNPLAGKIQLFSEKDTARHVYLTREQVTSIAGHIEDLETRGIVMLAAYASLRQGEILALTDANWRKPLIVLNAATKGKRPRTVPLVPELHGVMDALPFKVTVDTLRKRFRRTRIKAGMPHVRFHDLRHTFASWLAVEPDVPMTVLRDLLGHSTWR